MHFKRHLLASSALLAAILGSAAHAQTRSTQAAAANTIEELVVTAEKREQSLQDVPVAVTAFTSERRDLIGITTVQDMTNFTPGLQYSSQLDRTSLRGVGRLTNVHAAEGAVAVYSDGIYTTSTIEAGKSPIFTDRVEVLRGPQGTLYGRNAIAGAINVISKRPTETWYAEVRGRVENYDRSVVEGAVSGPTLIPGVQFRLVANWDKQREGWIKNVVPGQPDEGNVIDTKILEGQLKFHLNDRFEGWMKLAGYWWENGGGAPGSRYNWTPAPFPTYEFVNPTQGGQILSPGYACRPGTGVTNVVNPSPLGCVNPALTDPRKIASTVPYKVKLNGTAIFATEWIYHFDDMDLKYVGGATHYHYYLTGPTPVDQTAPITSYTLPRFTPGAPAVVNPRYGFDYQEKETWISHELNLASSGTGPLQWLAGAYYYHEEYEQPVFTTLFDQPETNGPFFLPATFCFRTAGVCAPNRQRRIYDDRPELTIDSRAVYGQIDWQVAEHWKTTLGLRYSKDHKFGSESVRLLCFDVAGCSGGFGPELLGPFLIDLTQLPSVVSYAPAVGVSSPTTVDPATGFASRRYDNKWSATTGTAGLQWDPAPGTMFYARYSRGYKAGGFRIGIDTVLGAAPNTGPEHADAYEVGMKRNFFDNTLQANLAVFRYDYQNAQVPISVSQTSGGVGAAQSIFYNIPKAISQGVELETIWQPIQNLQILFNYSYLDAHVTESRGVVDPADPAALDIAARPVVSLAQCQAAVGTPQACSVDIFTAALGGGFQRGQDLSGNRLPNAPRNKVAFNVNYTWRMSAGSITGSVSYIWRDAQYGSIFTRSYYRSPSYDQVDARVTWKSEDNRYSIILYGRNLLDDIGYEGGASAFRRAGFVPAYTLGLPGAPPAGAATAVPILQGIASTYPLTAPRTFGIELQYRFF